MIFKGPPAVSIWSSGGSVETRQGRADETRIRAMVGFYQATASRCLAKGDATGARYCAAMLEQIGDACRGAAEWARAATHEPEQPRAARAA